MAAAWEAAGYGSQKRLLHLLRDAAAAHASNRPSAIIRRGGCQSALFHTLVNETPGTRGCPQDVAMGACASHPSSVSCVSGVYRGGCSANESRTADHSLQRAQRDK
eukprot:4442517-Pleurochrysis_carterae.AAC.2